VAESEGKAFENALVDKLGENAIVWEKDGFSDSSKLWLTYEETIAGSFSSYLIKSYILDKYQTKAQALLHSLKNKSISSLSKLVIR
jgi:hypothetical protein